MKTTPVDIVDIMFIVTLASLIVSLVCVLCLSIYDYITYLDRLHFGLSNIIHRIELHEAESKGFIKGVNFVKDEITYNSLLCGHQLYRLK